MIAIEAVAVNVDTSAVCRSVGISRASFYRRRQLAKPSPRALGRAERQAGRPRHVAQ